LRDVNDKKRQVCLRAAQLSNNFGHSASASTLIIEGSNGKSELLIGKLPLGVQGSPPVMPFARRARARKLDLAGHETHSLCRFGKKSLGRFAGPDLR
jgi:hypothetical protein